MAKEKKKIKKDKENKSLIEFDTYFQGLLAISEGKILPHHKAPMRYFAEEQGLTKGTIEDFDRIFKSY